MYRNRFKINEIGFENHALMHALYSARLDSDLGRRLAAAFPECFNGEANEGPMPLAAILRRAEELTDDYLFQMRLGIRDFVLPYKLWSLQTPVDEENLHTDLPNLGISVGEEHTDSEGIWIVVLNRQRMDMRRRNSKQVRILLVPKGAVDMAR